MFSRYFGQTLGAAMFAAVFNSVLLNAFNRMPSTVVDMLPETNRVIEALQSSQTPLDTRLFLQETFHSAIHYVYIGLLIAAVATFLILLSTPAKPQPLADD